MHFKGKKSHIRCLGHVLNLVVKAILADLKARTVKETLNKVNTTSSAIAKLWHMVIWIGKSPQRKQQWNELSLKNIAYDNNTRWNSTYFMISNAIQCKKAVIQLIKQNAKDLLL